MSASDLALPPDTAVTPSNVTSIVDVIEAFRARIADDTAASVPWRVIDRVQLPEGLPNLPAANCAWVEPGPETNTGAYTGRDFYRMQTQVVAVLVWRIRPTEQTKSQNEGLRAAESLMRRLTDRDWHRPWDVRLTTIAPSYPAGGEWLVVRQTYALNRDALTR